MAPKLFKHISTIIFWSVSHATPFIPFLALQHPRTVLFFSFRRISECFFVHTNVNPKYDHNYILKYVFEYLFYHIINITKYGLLLKMQNASKQNQMVQNKYCTLSTDNCQSETNLIRTIWWLIRVIFCQLIICVWLPEVAKGNMAGENSHTAGLKSSKPKVDSNATLLPVIPVFLLLHLFILCAVSYWPCGTPLFF